MNAFKSFFAVAVLGVASLASAQKVAVVNPARVFNDLQETKDLKTKMESDNKGLQAQETERRTKLRDLQQKRDALKPDSQQYNDTNKELMQGAIEFESWGKLTQIEVQRQQKMQMLSLYKKIVDATSQVSAQKGLDLVIAEQRPDLPDGQAFDQLNVDQVRLLINSRNVLFSNPSVDITTDVIAAMDAAYKAGK